MLDNYSFLVKSFLYSFVQSFETEQERTMYVSAVLLILPYLLTYLLHGAESFLRS